MEKAKIKIFKAEVQNQQSEIERVYKQIDERSHAKSKIEIESLAFWLHNLYCAFEDLFEMIAQHFENNIATKDQYHIELLKRMCISIPGVRPALLSDESFKLLDKLRAFRHLIRHAYVYDLDERQVRLVLEDAVTLSPFYQGQIQKFLDQLD